MSDMYDDDEPAISEITIDGIDLKLTCMACPEQYDAFKDGEKVGYLRLRWGHFRVDFPDYSGETIYSTDVGDGWCGIFDDSERLKYLQDAVVAINKKLEER